jgi:hypothetical protein
MKIIRVYRQSYTHTYDVRVKGYLEPETRHFQYLRYVIQVFGLNLFKWTYHTDQIPSGNWWSYICTGMTTWKSSRPDLVDQVIADPDIFVLSFDLSPRST